MSNKVSVLVTETGPSDPILCTVGDWVLHLNSDSAFEATIEISDYDREIWNPIPLPNGDTEATGNISFGAKGGSAYRLNVSSLTDPILLRGSRAK